MENIVINIKGVKKNKNLKVNQKSAKHLLGKRRHPEYKGNINTILPLKNVKFFNFAKEEMENLNEVNSYIELLKLLKKEHICGLSGDKSDIPLKFETFLRTIKEHNLIVNAVECDPGLIHDYYSLNHNLDDVISALDELDKIINFDNIIIASKSDISIKDKKIKAHRLKNVYPMGYENFIIKEIFNKEIRRYPSEEGFLVINLQTLLEIYRVLQGYKFNSRLITVGNLITGEGCVIRANFGQSIKEIISKVYPIDGMKIYAGGGLLFSHPLLENEVIDEGTSFIAINYQDEMVSSKCKKCGGCSKCCPMHLDLRKIVNEYETKKVISINTSTCIGCGMCSYVCAASIDIRKIVKQNN